MTIKYSEYKTDLGVTFIVKEAEDGTINYIPTDPANSDYQAYLAKDEVKADEAKTK